MLQKLHRNARTNYAIRLAIKQSKESISALARKYNLSWNTVKKWKTREGIEDLSSCPIRTRTTLTKEEEDLIIFERKKFKKTIEEIFFSLEGKIENIYPLKIYRCLARYGLSSLPEELLKAERRIKKFRKYTIGYLHIDTLYTPKIDGVRLYIFTCIDRLSKLAFIWVSKRKTKEMGALFLNKVIAFYPYRIHYILTDNGGEFTHKAYYWKDRLKKPHPFDRICQEHRIQHRTIRFKHPWTNGMIERFNQRIKNKVIRRYIFENTKDLKEKLVDYCNNYNFGARLRQLNYQTPALYLKEKYNCQTKIITIDK